MYIHVFYVVRQARDHMFRVIACEHTMAVGNPEKNNKITKDMYIITAASN